tara:strand:+ start:125 stop:748 length:624 start_codon:yes stop_codon:yes gene_type:complete
MNIFSSSEDKEPKFQDTINGWNQKKNWHLTNMKYMGSRGLTQIHKYNNSTEEEQTKARTELEKKKQKERERRYKDYDNHTNTVFVYESILNKREMLTEDSRKVYEDEYPFNKLETPSPKLTRDELNVFNYSPNSRMDIDRNKINFMIDNIIEQRKSTPIESPSNETQTTGGKKYNKKTRKISNKKNKQRQKTTKRRQKTKRNKKSKK